MNPMIQTKFAQKKILTEILNSKMTHAWGRREGLSSDTRTPHAVVLRPAFGSVLFVRTNVFEAKFFFFHANFPGQKQVKREIPQASPCTLVQKHEDEGAAIHKTAQILSCHDRGDLTPCPDWTTEKWERR